MITRLQLGTSRLENIRPEVREKFLDKSWLHLGDPENEALISKSFSISYLFEIFKSKNISFIFTKIFQKIYRNKRRNSNRGVIELYSETNFKVFYFRKADMLPFDDNSIDFIYSEHFFEHLFFDEAFALFRECHRILKPYGVIRTCVPDADLRIYEKPEPLGFPNKKLPYSDPGKHKTRWSVYALEETLRLAGFESQPLRYCDKWGKYNIQHPLSNADAYDRCPEKEMIFDLSYIYRTDSLIIDGIKKSF